MNKNNYVSKKTSHKKKLRELRLKKLEQKLKANLNKRKKNKIIDAKVLDG